MTRRLLTLLRKELRQHGLAIVATLAFVTLVYVVMLLGRASSLSAVTIMEVHATFTRFCVPLLAAIVGHRLVVTELHGRTQLFLEGLPLRRAEWMGLKGLLGLWIVAGAAFASLCICTLVAARSEPMSAPFFALLSARTLVWSACVWSFFLAMGVSGRLRFLIYVAMGSGLYVVDALTDVEWRRVSPFSLVDARMALERAQWPAHDLWIGLGLSLGLAGIAALLSTINEGSLSESLSRRISQKEQALLAIVVCATLIGITVFEEEKAKEPYQLQGATVQRSTRAALSIDAGSRSDHARQRTKALLGMVEQDLLELGAWLRLSKLPPVFIAHRSDLDGRTIEHVKLTENEGVLLRANFTAPDWEPEQLRFELLQKLMDAKSKGRSRFEPKAWVSDGLLRWWVERNRAPNATSLSLLRGLWATRERAVTESLLRRWTRTSERLGPDVATGLAHTGIEVIARTRGRAAVDALARAFLASWAPKDARSLLYERAHPMEGLVAQAAGRSWQSFLSLWNAQLATLRKEPQFQRLQTLPAGRVQVDALSQRGTIRDVRFVVELDRPAPDGTVVSLAHRVLGAYDVGQVEKLDLEREDAVWPVGALRYEGTLRGAYSRGDRALLAVEIQGMGLGTALRLHAERRSFE